MTMILPYGNQLVSSEYLDCLCQPSSHYSRWSRDIVPKLFMRLSRYITWIWLSLGIWGCITMYKLEVFKTVQNYISLVFREHCGGSDLRVYATCLVWCLRENQTLTRLEHARGTFDRQSLPLSRMFRHTVSLLHPLPRHGDIMHGRSKDYHHSSAYLISERQRFLPSPFQTDPETSCLARYSYMHLFVDPSTQFFRKRYEYFNISSLWHKCHPFLLYRLGWRWHEERE